MKLLFDGIEKVLDFEKHNICTLAVENKSFYLKLVENLINTLNGDDEKVWLYDNEKEISISKKVLLISDVFNIDFNTTKLTSALNANLKAMVSSSDLQIEYLNLVRCLTKFFDDVKKASDFSIDWKSEIDLSLLLKMASYKFTEYESAGLLNRVLDYMKLCTDVLNTSLFVFINSKIFFEKDELNVFYRQCVQEGLNILNLDCISLESVNENEKNIIIDKDFCEIY